MKFRETAPWTTPRLPAKIMKKKRRRSGRPPIILVHNHPSGDPTPSKADVDMTRDIIAAAPFGIIVHDHLIVAAA